MGTGGKSAKMEVTDYHLSVLFGVCYGPIDAFLGLRINEKDVWAGTNSGTAFEVSKRDLFGGPKKEGGVEGRILPLFGGGTQVLPDSVAARWGETGATSPAYRGLFTLFLSGLQSSEGDATNPIFGGIIKPIFTPTKSKLKGFMWSTNNPMVAQTVWTRQRRIPKAIPGGASFATIDGGSKAGLLANPAEMIYEALVNKQGGMGGEAALIDTASFLAGSETFYNEGFGLSMKWENGVVQSYIQEICNHAQCAVYQSPETGLFTLKLIRDDYDPETLFEISADNANLKSFSRKLLGETVTQITVQYTDPDTEEEVSVTYHNEAARQSQRSAVTDTRKYYGIRTPELAGVVAQRDCWAASAPLASATVEIDRSGWNLVPHQAVRLSWPEKFPDVLIMRVGRIDYGRPGDRKIKVSLYQDIFSLSRPPIFEVPGSEAEDDAQAPVPMDYEIIWTLPYFFISSPSYNPTPRTLPVPEVIAGALAYSEETDVRGFELLVEDLSPTTGAIFVNGGSKEITGRVDAPDALVQEAQSTYTSDLPIRPELGPQIGGFIMFGDGGDADSEIAAVVGTSGENWVLNRGVLDTVPRAWSAGTPMWFISPGRNAIDDKNIRVEGEEPTFKFLTKTSLGYLAEDDAAEVSVALTSRPHRPNRPANVKINGSLWGTIALGPTDDIVITWSNRNRLLEDVQVLSWTDSGVPPEYRQRTVITVVDPDAGDALIRQYTHLWSEETYTLDRDWFAKYDKVKVIVSSEREGFSSIQGRSFIVTGLDNNSGAANPPAPPAEGIPPPPVPAPDPLEWSAVGGTDTTPGGASVPVINITGTPVIADYRGAIIRYRKTGTTDWNVWPEVNLNDPN